MTANDIRRTVRPITLAWTIYEHKVPANELQNFTKEELRKILRVSSIETHKEIINRLLKT